MQQLNKIFYIGVVEFIIIYGFNLDGIRELVFIGEKLHFSASFGKKVVIIICMVDWHMCPKGIFDANVKISDNNK